MKNLMVQIQGEDEESLLFALEQIKNKIKAKEIEYTSKIFSYTFKITE